MEAHTEFMLVVLDWKEENKDNLANLMFGHVKLGPDLWLFQWKDLAKLKLILRIGRMGLVMSATSFPNQVKTFFYCRIYMA